MRNEKMIDSADDDVYKIQDNIKNHDYWSSPATRV